MHDDDESRSVLSTKFMTIHFSLTLQKSNKIISLWHDKRINETIQELCNVCTFDVLIIKMHKNHASTHKMLLHKISFVIHFYVIQRFCWFLQNIFSEINKTDKYGFTAAPTKTTHDDNEILYYFCIYDACGADINQRHIWHMIINLLICINNCIATFFSYSFYFGWFNTKSSSSSYK